MFICTMKIKMKEYFMEETDNEKPHKKCMQSGQNVQS